MLCQVVPACRGAARSRRGKALTRYDTVLSFPDCAQTKGRVGTVTSGWLRYLFHKTCRVTLFRMKVFLWSRAPAFVPCLVLELRALHVGARDRRHFPRPEAVGVFGMQKRCEGCTNQIIRSERGDCGVSCSLRGCFEHRNAPFPRLSSFSDVVC